MAGSNTFRRVRLIFLVFAILIAAACTAAYAFLLIRTWALYSTWQRSIMLAMTVIHGFGIIIFIWMMFSKLRIWEDVGRVTVFLLLQIGSGISFTIFSRQLPCADLGFIKSCSIVVTAVSLASGTLSALLAVYVVCLIVFRTRIERQTPNAFSKAQQASKLTSSSASSLEKSSIRSKDSGESFYATSDHSAGAAPLPIASYSTTDAESLYNPSTYPHRYRYEGDYGRNDHRSSAHYAHNGHVRLEYSRPVAPHSAVPHRLSPSPSMRSNYTTRTGSSRSASPAHYESSHLHQDPGYGPVSRMPGPVPPLANSPLSPQQYPQPVYQHNMQRYSLSTIPTSLRPSARPPPPEMNRMRGPLPPTPVSGYAGRLSPGSRPTTPGMLRTDVNRSPPATPVPQDISEADLVSPINGTPQMPGGLWTQGPPQPQYYRK